MSQGFYENLKVGQHVVFHDERQCEIAGTVREHEDLGDYIRCVLDLDDGGTYVATINTMRRGPTEISRLTKAIVAQKDGLMKDAISHKLGRSDWRIAELTGRCEMRILPDKSEIFSLDGCDLIQFYPPKTKIDNNGLGMSIKSAQEYRLLD